MDERIIKILLALNKQARETLKIANELYEKGSEFLVSLLSALLGVTLTISILLYVKVSTFSIIFFGFISFFIFFLIGLLLFRTVLTSRFSQERKVSELSGETEILQAELNNLRERNKLREANEVFLKTRLTNVKDVIVEIREIKKLSSEIDEEKVANEMINQVYKDFKEEDEKTDLLLSYQKAKGSRKTEVQSLSSEEKTEEVSDKTISETSKNTKLLKEKE